MKTNSPRLLALAILTAAWVAGPLAAGEPAAVMLTGKVVPAPAAKGAKAAGVNFVAQDGKTYSVVKDETSKLLFLDPALHNRPLRLTTRVAADSLALTVQKVQTVKDGKIFDVDYWCDRCQLAARATGPCLCCGDLTVLRELPAK